MKRLRRSETTDQRGIVSLFTVIFFTILVTVLTIGFVRIMLNERRQSTDEDLSSRAFYAAESGVEDVKRALEKYQNFEISRADLNENSCAPVVGYSKTISTNPDVGYSCKLINLTPPNIEATLPGDGNSMMWPLFTKDHIRFKQVRISWHSLTEPAVDGTPVALRAPADNTNPQVGNWNNAGTPYPAMLRAQFFGHPHNAVFGRTELEARNRVTFLNPTNSGPTGEMFINALDDGNPATGKPLPQDIGCTTNDTALYGGYACQAVINVESLLGGDFFNDVLYLRLKSLYDQGGTKVKIELLDGPQVLDVKSQVLIDVTGRAGDVYRRVQARVNLTNPALLPEYAIESGDAICKRFELTDTAEELNGCAVR